MRIYIWFNFQIILDKNMENFGHNIIGLGEFILGYGNGILLAGYWLFGWEGELKPI